MSAFHGQFTLFPANPVFYRGLSSLSKHPAHRIRQLASASSLCRDGGRRVWSGWQIFSGNPGFVEHDRALRVHLGKSHFPGENGVSEKVSD